MTIKEEKVGTPSMSWKVLSLVRSCKCYLKCERSRHRLERLLHFGLTR
jgi:hypothetical protein